MAPRIFLVMASETKEMSVALRYAALRAREVEGHVAILSVLPPSGMQLWRAVEEQLVLTGRRDAENRLQELGEMAHAASGRMAIYYFREGQPRDALLKLLEEDKSFAVLVLGASKSADGPGPMVNYLSGKGLARITLPLVIVPEDYLAAREQARYD